MKRNVRVVTILCAGMIGVGVLTGCSQANGNVPVNGSGSNGVKSVNSVNATSQIDTQKEIVQVKSMQNVLNTMDDMEKKLIQLTESYLQANDGKYVIDNSLQYNDVLKKTNDAVNQEQHTFDSAFNVLENKTDERPIVDDMNKLFGDIITGNLDMENAVLLNDQNGIADAIGEQKIQVEDMGKAHSDINVLLNKLGGN